MPETIHFEVQDTEHGLRLDSFLAARMADASRSSVRRWIEADRVRVNGGLKKASYKVSSGEEVTVSPLPPEPTDLVPEDLPLDILFEDDQIIVINKPAGLVVHPGAGNWSGTLANALAYHFKEISNQGSLRPGIVHRLDKGTSGVLVVAKNEVAHDFLAGQFQDRQVEKKYLALLYGRLSSKSGEIDLAIGRDRKSRVKISPRTSRPKPALTRYDVVRYVGNFTLVEAFPKTGRTHQIRVHFHHLGHPVVGDETYARKGFITQLTPPKLRAIRQFHRLFLHAASLTLLHPRTREPIRFEAQLPTELAELIETLGE